MVTPVSITHQFNGDTSAADLVDAADLDTQLGNLATTLNAEIVERQRTVRDGSGLASQVVRFPSLHPEITALLTAGGMIPLQAAVILSTSNLTLSGLQTIDGYTQLAGDRTMLTGQSNALQNGLWIAAVGAWTRAPDTATGTLLAKYTTVNITNGSTQSGAVWMLSAASTVDSSAQTWLLYSGLGTVISIARGGTGATTASGARTALGIPSQAMTARSVVANDTAGAADGVVRLIDDITVLADGSTTRRDLSARAADLFYAKDYGLVADNTTDDTAALQAAMNACGVAGGGFVVLPRGTIRITAQVTFNYANVILVGQGIYATVLRHNHATQNMFSDSGVTLQGLGMRDLRLHAAVVTSGECVLLTGGGLNYRFQNVMISGDGSGSFAVGMRIRNSQRANLIGLAFEASGTYGLVLDGASNAVAVVGCNFRGCINGAMVAFQGGNPVVASSFFGCLFENNTLRGMIIDSCNCCVVDGCYFELNNVYSLELKDTQVDIDRPYGNVIRGCFFQGATTKGIYVTDGNRNTFADCTFTSDSGGLTVAAGTGNRVIRPVLFGTATITDAGTLTILESCPSDILRLSPFKLGGDALASLSYYDEGVWTPTLIGQSTAGVQTYTAQVGKWTRVGRMVTVQCRLTINAKDAATAGDLSITGLPFAIGSGNAYASACFGFWGLVTFAGGRTTLGGIATAGNTRIDLYQSGGAIAMTTLTAAGFVNGTDLLVSMTYMV